ncbi:hypothetical protein CASFOL_041763 [Castilleja foliolosa]|uniref:Uncharacterized protein n=1 Tax=Castilleja foliolosa TaxID=1961234 RepID=A0ABD3B8U9_9LAMI
MATLNCFFHLIMAFMLHSSLLFSYFPEKSAALDTPECLSYFTDGPGIYLKERPQSTLELFHRDGPCSPAAGNGPMNMPSPQDILHRDRLRVQSLQSRFESKTNKYDSLSQDTKLVVNVIEGEYATSISLGTPEQKLTLGI